VYLDLNRILSRGWHEPADALRVANITGHRAVPGEDMKIYLLMLIIGTLLTAIHFTSAPQKRSETQPQ
jgi:hypothetical protein